MGNKLYSGRSQFARPSGNSGARPDEKGRGAFRKDYARLLHAPSFRRLQGKTQLFPGGQSDYFRNRLTHSLEVAQIARGIAARLNQTSVRRPFGREAAINEDLVEFAAIAHDLGHPPFGHNGEHALDLLMKDHGGFEGNAQTLRILTSIERKLVGGSTGEVAARYGLDLTYRSLASVLKYDRPIPLEREGDGLVKGYYDSESAIVWEIKRRVAPRAPVDQPFKTIECAIMDVADDIAYSTYDLEDSLHAGFYTPLSLANALATDESIQGKVISKTNKALRENNYAEVLSAREVLGVVSHVFGLDSSLWQARAGGSLQLRGQRALAAAIVTHSYNQSIAEDGLFRTKLTAERVGALISAVKLVPNKEFPQLSGVRLNRSELLQVEVMKHLNYELVIRSPRLAVVEHRGKDLVTEIFLAILASKGSLLPADWQKVYSNAVDSGEGGVRRVVCDFVSCMTDRYAVELYGRLFGEDSTIFKPL